jgi:hypothetical protein
MEADKAAKLRQQLAAKIAELEKILRPAFDREPVFPANVHVSQHRCGKPSCRCASSGDLHEAVRLQIRFQDGLANRCLSEEEAAFWKPRTQAYQRIRQAGRSFRSWQKEVSELLDALERARRSLEGLSQEDRKRPLR